jgi:hypothetical protein
MSSVSNAIQLRLALLQDQWTEFALDPRARLLRWVVAPDEVCIVEALWARESDERAAETPDLLLRLRSSFEDPEQHGLLLRRELVEMVGEAQETLAEEGARSRWFCPSPVPGSNDVQALVAALEAFRAAHAPAEGVVGVWLDPQKISDERLYVAWLQQLAKAAPGGCRCVVLEDPACPEFEELASGEPGRVRSAVADLDMPAAQEEISRQSGDLSTPGGRFRHLFVQMSNAAKKGEVARAAELADRAAVVAEEQEWLALAAAAHMTLGAALAGSQPQQAMERYRLAEEFATRDEARGGRQCRLVRLHARMARGAVLISTGAFAEAASWYRETAPVAEAAQDERSVVDCWRLASYSHEQSGALEAAWDAGVAGFEVGRKLDAQAKKASSLPYLAEGLMRLTSKRPLRSHARGMEELIVAALGRDWRPSTTASEQAASAAASRGS